MAKVTVLFGSEVQSERTLDKPELRVGRAMDCDVIVDNLGVSRHHCSIVQDGHGWAVADKGSNNGTFVNGQKVSHHVLKNGDKVVLGKHSLVFDEHGVATHHEAKTTAGMGGEMTMFVDQAALAKMVKASEGGAKRMAISLKQGGRDVVVALVKDETVIGSAPTADVPAKGLFVKATQAKVVRHEQGHRLIASGGLRAVLLNGAKVKEAVLNPNDIIVIAGQSYLYRLG